MKRLALIMSVVLVAGPIYGGTITKPNTFTAGTVIDSSDMNDNFDTIYNEFNGSISAANLAVGSVDSSEIVDGSITTTELATNVVSTLTYVNTFGTYKRPVLLAAGLKVVDVENNTGTANQTCIHFPDEQRCVTENTSLSNVNRRLDITATASNSGTKDSGLVGAAVTTNNWYALYGWKVSDNSTDFVIAGTTNTPVQANYTRLESMFGHNKYVYLGLIRVGNNSDYTANILPFEMDGNYTVFYSSCAGNSLTGIGTRLASSAGTASLSYSPTVGTGATDIPNNVFQVKYGVAGTPGTNGVVTIRDVNGTRHMGKYHSGGGSTSLYAEIAGAEVQQLGLNAALSTSGAADIFLVGFIDRALGIGYNPQF